jgi:hypothetical protein
MGKSTPRTTRSYQHSTCGGVTEVGDDDFDRLANPFSLVWGQTYCSHCEEDVSLDELYWTDTQESLAAFRARMRRSAPLSMMLVGWGAVPLAGFLLAGLIGWLLIGDLLFGFVGIGLIGGVVSAAFAMPLLTRFIWKTDFRNRK